MIFFVIEYLYFSNTSNTKFQNEVVSHKIEINFKNV